MFWSWKKLKVKFLGHSLITTGVLWTRSKPRNSSITPLTVVVIDSVHVWWSPKCWFANRAKTSGNIKMSLRWSSGLIEMDWIRMVLVRARKGSLIEVIITWRTTPLMRTDSLYVRLSPLFGTTSIWSLAFMMEANDGEQIWNRLDCSGTGRLALACAANELAALN